MDFISWLEALPADTVGKLYSSHWACQAVLRGLPPLAKQYVLRLLFLDAPVPAAVVESWPAQKAQAKHRAALDRLANLQLLPPTSIVGSRGGRTTTYELQPVFRESLRSAVTHGTKASEEAVPPQVAEVAPSREALSKYAQQQWEALMLFLVGSTDRPPAPSPLLKAPRLAVEAILSGAGLMTGSKKERAITEAGFRFLLLDTYSQLWLILREYIAGAEQRSGSPLGAALNFLLQLGFRAAGSAFALDTLDASQRAIAADVSQLGLLMPFKAERGGVWLTPTRLALALAGGVARPRQGDLSQGFIVVETNYRVYAYTLSALQAAILRLFCRCECVLPNLFVGVLTRDSVAAALTCGLTADQIIVYLRTHAHPHVAGRSPIVPEVVSDQVRLWQADTQRVRVHRAVLYDDFPSPEVFRLSAAKARALGAWLWDDPRGTGRLAVRADAHEVMRDYIKSIK